MKVQRGLLALAELGQAIKNKDDERIRNYNRSIGKYGYCECCGRESDLNQDHDHSNGLARGKLCRSCNVGIGFFKEDLRRLADAMDYLKKWRLAHYQMTDSERRKFVYKQGRKYPKLE